MSVSVVSPYLLHTQAAEFGNERHTDLIDALLASCQKASMNPRLPGFGRELQPYFSPEVVPARVNQKEAPQKPKGRQRKGKGKSSISSPSSSDGETSQRTSKTAAVTASKKEGPNDATKGQTIKAIHKHPKAEGTAGFAWAGPAFGMAPAPSEIPVPSDFLLA